MHRLLRTCALTLPLVAMCAAPLAAEVKTRDRTQVKLEGFLGRMVGMFGGRAAREGIVTTNAVRGDRKAEMTDTTGRIVDLNEEKIYELDMKRRTYQVVTFDDLRRRMREAREKAARDAREDEAQRQEQEKLAAEFEIDFDVKETGSRKAVAGHDAREVVMTVTIRPKGRTLEEAGGLVMTSNMWLGPEIAPMRELAEFEMRYWKAIAPEAVGMSAEQMAMIAAMYPMFSQAMERLNAESRKLEGTALATTMVLESVRSKAQMSESSGSRSTGRGLGGMIAGRMLKRDPQPRSTVFTANHEVLEISTDVTDADLEIPAGFKERK